MEKDNVIKFNIDEIILEIAQDNNTTVEKIEFYIRDLLEIAWKSGKLKENGFTEKPSIKEFLIFFFKNVLNPGVFKN